MHTLIHVYNYRVYMMLLSIGIYLVVGYIVNRAAPVVGESL